MSTTDLAIKAFDTATAAAAIGMKKSWLADQARRGLVPCTMFGRSRRFTAAQIEEIIAAREVRPITEHTALPRQTPKVRPLSEARVTTTGPRGRRRLARSA